MNYDLVLYLFAFLFLFFGIWYSGRFIKFLFSVLSGALHIPSWLKSRRSSRYD